MLDRKGHIPTTLLGLSHIVLVILAISVFVSYDSKNLGKFDSSLGLSYNLNFRELYASSFFEKAIERSLSKGGLDGLNERFVEDVIAREPKNPGEYGNFFAIVRNHDSSPEFFYERGNGAILRISDISLVVSDPKNINKIMRTFTFEARIAEDGSVQYIYK